MIRRIVQGHFALLVMILFVGLACLVLLVMSGAR